MTRFLGLSGYARAGKDTVATYLEEDGWRKVSFADRLKQAVRELDPIVHASEGKTYKVHDVWAVNQTAPQNWDRLKVEYPEVRKLLQRMGTEVGRKLFGANFWVEQAFASVPDDVPTVVFTDCRFPNEAQAIKDRGGEIWRINRPGHGPVNNHPSETSLDHWDFDVVINNDESLDHLRALVWQAVLPLGCEA